MRAFYLPLMLAASLWTPYGESCGQPAAMRCTSAGLVSEPQSGAISVRATVRVGPADDGRFWAGLALNADLHADNRYAQAAITQGIAPYWDQQASGVTLADGADRCCTVLGSIDPAQPHSLSVAYDGRGRATMCVDGVCDTVKIDLGASYVVELLCVGVDPGESGSNPVDCAYTDIAIEHPAPPAPPHARGIWGDCDD